MDDRTSRRGWSFWRDEAQLVLLAPKHRLKAAALTLSGTLIVVLVLVVPLDGTAFESRDTNTRITALAAISLILAAMLAIEMAVKAGRASARLRHRNNAPKNASAAQSPDERRQLQVEELVIKCFIISNADTARRVREETCSFLHGNVSERAEQEFRDIIDPIASSEFDSSANCTEIRENAKQRLVDYLCNVRQRYVS